MLTTMYSNLLFLVDSATSLLWTSYSCFHSILLVRLWPYPQRRNILTKLSISTFSMLLLYSFSDHYCSLQLQRFLANLYRQKFLKMCKLSWIWGISLSKSGESRLLCNTKMNSENILQMIACKIFQRNVFFVLFS